ncbi:hypothetical protein BOX15_Mlig029919g1, partial [Macrostomum lignano]
PVSLLSMACCKPGTCCQCSILVALFTGIFVTVAVFAKFAGLSHNELAILLGVYFGFQTLLAFILTSIDKCQAQSRGWRVAQAALYLCAFYCGFIGIILAMLICWHKVKKCEFVTCSLIFVPINAAWLLIAFLVVPIGLPGSLVMTNATNATNTTALIDNAENAIHHINASSVLFAHIFPSAG